MTHILFRSMLFSFQVFGDFAVTFLLLISILVPLWSENTFKCSIQFNSIQVSIHKIESKKEDSNRKRKRKIVLNLLKFVLWAIM